MRIKFLSLLGMSSLSLLLHATNETWILNGSGDWFNFFNWSSNPLVPSAPGDTAEFNSAGITVPVAVGLSASPTMGQLFIDNALSYTIGPGRGSLTIENSLAQIPTIEIDTANGNGGHEISANLTFQPTRPAHKTL